jgi:hypothetical protein
MKKNKSKKLDFAHQRTTQGWGIHPILALNNTSICIRRSSSITCLSDNFYYGRCRERIDAQPMSKGSGNAQPEGGTSELDSGLGEFFSVDHRPEVSLGCKGDDNGVVSDATSRDVDGSLCAAEESAALIAVARSPERGVEKYGRCCWEDCPKIKKVEQQKQCASSDTHMCCKECSAYLGKNVFLCNSFVNSAPVNFHRHYHIYHHNHAPEG